MLKAFRFCLLILISITSYAQQNYCGHIMTNEEWKIFDANRVDNTQHKETSTKDTVPLVIHLVAKSNNTGRMQIEKMLQSICELNAKYDPVNMYFYLKMPIKFIQNDNFYNHDWADGDIMMATNNVTKSVNLYFVGDPAENCGYFTYSQDAIALRNSCSLPGNTTIAHEVGHYFGLPHTFSGWENGNTPANPELVTRGTGKNCSTAGDKFCDTEADYISYRWNCPYTLTKYDSNGQLYHPDSSNYMCYANDICASRFSGQQMTSMSNRLNINRSNLLNQARPVSDSNLDTIKFNNAYTDTLYNHRTINWNNVPNAQAYHIKFHLTQLPSNLLIDTIIYNNSFTIPNNINFNSWISYSVSVRPINSISFCTGNYKKLNFYFRNSPDPTPNKIIEQNTPFNITHINITTQQLEIQIESSNYINTNLQICDMTGKVVFNRKLNLMPYKQNYNIGIPTLSPGMFILNLKNENQSIYQKVIVN